MMTKKTILLKTLFSGALLLAAGCSREAQTPDAFAGSTSCRECHENFYELWSTSHHGLAMQPADDAFSRRALTPLTNALEIAGSRFRTDAAARAVIEEGPKGTRSYPIVHAMGGKNVYYLLTPLERGRLQVLPVAYDVAQGAWFDAGASMVRHFTDGTPDAPLHWRDSQLTFNTACFGCHVSQLAKNYDTATDTYRTVWREPGINCEACHGPGAEHIRAFKDAPAGQPPADLKLISMRNLTRAQSDETCVTCHAKMRPLTTNFKPGDRFFDHYDLTTLENADFHPDGRDLGENYTYTLWLTSPCARSGQLDCTHCHTASGRNRFAGEKANNACLPCHQERVEKVAAHTRHKADSRGSLCVSCHMPTTTFARMKRTDHSMRPPTPAATLAFKSPNACTFCHTDKDAQWADTQVRAWHPDRDFQAPVLHRAGLVDAARRRDWTRLGDILAYIGDPASDPVFTTSLLRLLEPCDHAEKWPAIRQSLAHPHPLVRSAAAALLAGELTQQNFGLLAKAAQDDIRLVRVAAANALARYPQGLLDLPEAKPVCDAAFAELEASHACMPDSWASHYNLGNYYEGRGWGDRALQAYERATRLRPDMVPPLVNAAMMKARRGDLDASVALLRRAETADPRNPAVHLNLGMALAERNDLPGAERHFRAALAADPALAQAAYNLGVLLNRSGPVPEGVAFCRTAAERAPQHPGYVYTYAYYLATQGNTAEASSVLQEALLRGVTSDDITALLGSLMAGPRGR
ncbi:MAG: tetratricopeptide repeat protein [Verrucomicrobiota bacterium]|jgi:tetratricopeptide (TPR) repeat protein|nr:tetratricopeptide repeat protein [Verrucomicrobiota bacterium]